jgi:hypothetical protein
VTRNACAAAVVGTQGFSECGGQVRGVHDQLECTCRQVFPELPASHDRRHKRSAVLGAKEPKYACGDLSHCGRRVGAQRGSGDAPAPRQGGRGTARPSGRNDSCGRRGPGRPTHPNQAGSSVTHERGCTHELSRGMVKAGLDSSHEISMGASCLSSPSDRHGSGRHVPRMGGGQREGSRRQAAWWPEPRVAPICPCGMWLRAFTALPSAYSAQEPATNAASSQTLAVMT